MTVWGAQTYMNPVYRRLQCNESPGSGNVVLLLVHYVPLDTKAEAIVAPLDYPMVHGKAVIAVDNGRHELHRHPDRCIYKYIVVLGYMHVFGEDIQSTHPPHVCIDDTRNAWLGQALRKYT